MTPLHERPRQDEPLDPDEQPVALDDDVPDADEEMDALTEVREEHRLDEAEAGLPASRSPDRETLAELEDEHRLDEAEAGMPLGGDDQPERD
jgi:hypothetical protein